MKSVTLLRPRETYVLGLGSQAYQFSRDVPVDVPDDVAEVCRQKRGDKGRPIFRVDETAAADPDPDVAELFGVQLKFRAFQGEGKEQEQR